MIRYSPITGARLVQPLSERHPSLEYVLTAWRQADAGDWKYDPFTGGYRKARDIQSDPLGYKLVPPPKDPSGRNVVTDAERLEQARAHLKAIYEMAEGKVKEEARIALGLPESKKILKRNFIFNIDAHRSAIAKIRIEMTGDKVTGVELDMEDEDVGSTQSD